jgi:cyclopropane fatty-acyl-phospholipid synthase-like methyltransferase
MATSRDPQRLVWVRCALAVEPGEHLLEIGCGRGAAVSLICEKLTDGRITAIDRSASAIAAAERQTQSMSSPERRWSNGTELAAAELDDHRFDKIFAVNVNLFWVRRPTRELALIDRLLLPGGALHLFYGYGRPGPGRSDEIVGKLTANFTQGGFSVGDVVMPSEDSSHMLHVVARPHPVD